MLVQVAYDQIFIPVLHLLVVFCAREKVRVFLRVFRDRFHCAMFAGCEAVLNPLKQLIADPLSGDHVALPVD